MLLRQIRQLTPAVSLAVGPLLICSSARAGVLIGSVLYPLSPPAGFSSVEVETAAQGQVGGYGNDGGNDHALLWNSSGGATDLNPTAGITTSFVNGVGGTQQVGYGNGTATGSDDHAMLWTGTANSAVDLNPTSLGITNSYGFSTDGAQQVGDGYGAGTGNDFHALLWTGSAGSAVDLNPTSLGITNSDAYDLSGNQQVGYGTGSTGYKQAFLWTGTAASAVDLNPTSKGYESSNAYGIGGNQQVGDGFTSTSDDRALLWTGSANSVVNLSPSGLGMTDSTAFGTNGYQQVGYGDGSGTDEYTNALLWNGTAASAVNLQSLLPASGSWTYSYAYSIDNAGVAFGTAYGTFNGATGLFAVQWSPPSWANPAGGSWQTAGNWLAGTVPTSTGASLFNLNSPGYTVTVPMAVTLGSLVVGTDNVTFSISQTLSVTGNLSIGPDIGDAATLTLAGGTLAVSGQLLLGNSSSIVNVTSGLLSVTGPVIGSGSLNVSSGGVLSAKSLEAGAISIGSGSKIEVNLQQPRNAALSVSEVGQLTITGGQLELGDSDLIVHGDGTQLPSITSYLASGFNNGAWNGSGIVSSAAGGNTTHLTALGSLLNDIGGQSIYSLFDGQSVTTTDVLVMYTYYGDANLSGVVDASDYSLIDNGYLNRLTGWYNGDFNYDGVVNGSDYTLIDNAFNRQGASLAASVAPGVAITAEVSGFATVPDPVGLGIMALGASLLARHRSGANQSNG